MLRKVILTLGCLALVVAFSGAAYADAITFSFVGTKSSPAVTINATGVVLGPNPLLAISDSDTNNVFVVPGTVSISTGPASSYVAAAGVLTADFMPGPGIEVQVDSPNCNLGTMPGVCLQGILNSSGAYVAFVHSTGSFQAVFQVTYVDPYVTDLFGDPNTWLPTGSDSFTTGHNNFANGGKTDMATVGQGGVTFQTVPEPATLALLGAGLLGLAGTARRKRR